MPQVWLTYRELGDVYGMSEDDARAQAIDSGWPRRKSSDGLSRVKLPPAAAHEFMMAYAAAGKAVDVETPVGARAQLAELEQQLWAHFGPRLSGARTGPAPEAAGPPAPEAKRPAA